MIVAIGAAARKPGGKTGIHPKLQTGPLHRPIETPRANGGVVEDWTAGDAEPRRGHHRHVKKTLIAMHAPGNGTIITIRVRS